MAQAGKTRKSVLGIKKEVTEGVLIMPTASTDFTALSDGFTMAPSFEELTSSELQGSIGQSRSVLGAENPEASMSHYLRGSGVEAQKPDFNLLVEATMGEVAVTATERAAIAASTVSLVKVGVGFGSEFERGKALLVKKSGGYEVRNVLSVSGDDLSLAQDLANATGLVGANLGKAILYKPADTLEHPTLSLVLYRGNGTNVEAESGVRVTEMSVTCEAGQFITADYSMAGIKYFLNPQEVTSSTDTIDWIDDAGTWAVALDSKVYRDPHELADALANKMNATSSEVFTVVYSNSTGKFTIATATSVLFSILWVTGVNNAQSSKDVFGFSADSTGSLSYTSALAIDLAAPATPDYDSAQPLVAKANEVLLGSSTEITCFGAQSVSFTIANTKADIPDICEESGRSGSIIQSREVTIDIVSLLGKYDVSKFKTFREGGSIMFAYNGGEKSGGSWIPGKVVNTFVPSATITSFEVTDTDGMVTLEMSLRAFVQDGLGEVYINFL